MKVSVRRVARAFHLSFIEQELEGLDAFVHVAHDFIRHGIERSEGGGMRGCLREEALGVLTHTELAVAIGKDAAIEPRPDDCMLVAALEEMGDDQALELDLHLQLGHFLLELVGFEEGLDLGDTGEQRLQFHVALGLLLFLPFGGGAFFLEPGAPSMLPSAAILAFHSSRLRSFSRLVGVHHALVVVERPPGRKDLESDGVAQ